MNIDEFASQHVVKKVAADAAAQQKSPKKKMCSQFSPSGHQPLLGP
jgi:hypothetical protein